MLKNERKLKYMVGLSGKIDDIHKIELAVLYNPGSIQLSLSQAKAEPSIAWARCILIIAQLRQI